METKKPRLPGRNKFLATRLIAVVVFMLLQARVSAQFDEFQQRIADFDAEVARGVAEDAGGCVMIAVFIGDKQVWSRAYGWADIENNMAATTRTIGRTGSISKSFTAVLAVQSAERGLLELDDPVSKYFPEIERLDDPPDQMQPITFRMLASHTAGLNREPQLRGAASGSIYQWEEKVFASIPATSFRSSPGSEYSYSNIGFGILGLACSRAAKQPFMQLVSEQIFMPLEMTSSTFIVNDPDQIRRLAVGYTRDRRSGDVDATWATREHFGRGYKVPNGGIYSTVGDLAKFAGAIMGESEVAILSPENRSEILTPQAPAEHYGLGFTINHLDGLKIVGHSGSVAGYNADLRFELNSKVGVAMLRTTNYNPPTSQLTIDLAHAAGELQPSDQ